MLKTSFQITNLLLIIFYLYPGSILGCLFYDNCNFQPSLTTDFVISSNHFFAFLIFGLIALNAFLKERNIIIIYIFFISIFLEIMHIIIPNRSFEIKDLFGNLSGIIISLIIFKLFEFGRNKYGLFRR